MKKLLPSMYVYTYILDRTKNILLFGRTGFLVVYYLFDKRALSLWHCDSRTSMKDNVGG